MSAGQPEIPAQTITISSDQFGKEMADRLRRKLTGFRVFRSAYYVRMQHMPCLEILRTMPEITLIELVEVAMSHECQELT